MRASIIAAFPTLLFALGCGLLGTEADKGDDDEDDDEEEEEPGPGAEPTGATDTAEPSGGGGGGGGGEETGGGGGGGGGGGSTYDTGLLYWAFVGEGTRSANGSYTGTEAYWLFGIPNSQLLCEFTYTATATPGTASAPCRTANGDVCMFTLDITLANGVETAGDCQTLFGGPLPTDGGSYTYGHVEQYIYAGTDYGPALMYYYTGTYGTGWYWTGFADFDQATGAWAYEWPVGYYIYYL